MPTSAQDPRPRLGFARGSGHHGHNLVPILDVAKIQNHLRTSQAHEVPVPLNESWYREASTQVDHFRRRSDKSLHLLIGSNSRDLSATSRECLSLGGAGFQSDQFSVAQHQVRGLGEQYGKAEKQGI